MVGIISNVFLSASLRKENAKRGEYGVDSIKERLCFQKDMENAQWKVGQNKSLSILFGTLSTPLSDVLCAVYALRCSSLATLGCETHLHAALVFAHRCFRTTASTVIDGPPPTATPLPDPTALPQPEARPEANAAPLDVPREPLPAAGPDPLPRSTVTAEALPMAPRTAPRGDDAPGHAPA